ncbi:MAG: FAD-binding oxidoreductase [Acidobacteriota bacterium]
MSWSADGPAPSLWLRRPGPAREVDYAVVGGGVVGLSTAYWLARDGHQPLLLEADDLAQRASGRNAGFLLSGVARVVERLSDGEDLGGTLEMWRATVENRELVRRELIDSGRVDCDFQPEGSWMATVGDPAPLEAACEVLRREGFDAHWKSRAEARAACGSPAVAGGIFQPRDGGLDPLRLCRGMVAAGGFEVRTSFRVRAVEAVGERVRLSTDGDAVLARRVILALNAYAPNLLPALGGWVRPVRAQVLATAPGERTVSGVWYLDEGYEYLRQLADGTFLLGGRRMEAESAERGCAEVPTGTVQGALEAFLRQNFPSLVDRPVVHRWAGTMAFTRSGLPLLGRLAAAPAAIYAAGFNGHGLSLGFWAGRHLASAATGRAELADFPLQARPAADQPSAESAVAVSASVDVAEGTELGA